MNLDSVTLTAEPIKATAPPSSVALLYLNSALVMIVLPPLLPTNIAPPFSAALSVKLESLMVPLDAIK